MHVSELGPLPFSNLWCGLQHIGACAIHMRHLFCRELPLLISCGSPWLCYPLIVIVGCVMDNFPSDQLIGKNGSLVESYLLHTYLQPVIGYFDSSRYTVSLRGDSIFGDPEDFQYEK